MGLEQRSDDLQALGVQYVHASFKGKTGLF